MDAVKVRPVDRSPRGGGQKDDLALASPLVAVRARARRFRLVEWPVPNSPNWELCVPAGAVELGVPVQPDDDLVLLYPEGTEPIELDSWVAMLRAEGHEVVS